MENSNNENSEYILNKDISNLISTLRNKKKNSHLNEIIYKCSNKKMDDPALSNSIKMDLTQRPINTNNNNINNKNYVNKNIKYTKQNPLSSNEINNNTIEFVKLSTTNKNDSPNKFEVQNQKLINDNKNIININLHIKTINNKSKLNNHKIINTESKHCSSYSGNKSITKNLISLNKSRLYISTCELLINYLFCKNLKTKKSLLSQAEKMFFFHIDIRTYLRKMLEIDVIKYLLLDENTLEIMKFVNKPSFGNKQVNCNINSYSSVIDYCLYSPSKSNYKEVVNIEKLKIAYKNIADENALNPKKIQQRMQGLIEHQMEEIFKCI